MMSVDMARVGVMAAYCDPMCVYVTICCHNTDPVHANGHDRIILEILAKHCTRLPDDGSPVIRNMLEQVFYNFNCIYIFYIVH